MIPSLVRVMWRVWNPFQLTSPSASYHKQVNRSSKRSIFLLSIYLSTYLSIQVSIHLLIYLAMYICSISIYLSSYLSISTSIHSYLHSFPVFRIWIRFRRYGSGVGYRRNLPKPWEKIVLKNTIYTEKKKGSRPTC